MNPLSDNTGASLRRAVYWLLIVTSAAAMTGRIVSVHSADGKTPFLSANDRSRWCTIRALVDYRRYSIDEVVVRDPHATDYRRKFDPSWQSIDMVRHKGPDGFEHYYSSKPALLPTLLAGLYWIIKAITGVGLGDHPFYVARYMLIITNVLPLVGAFVCLYRIVERCGTTHWGRIFVMACATWGTFLTTFAVTLNNHVPAAVCALVAVYAALPIWWGETKHVGNFIVAGLLAALAAAFELPALSLVPVLAVALLIRSPWKTLIAYVPPVLLVAAAFFLTEYAAHGDWKPPYAHRQDGPVVKSIDPVVKTSNEPTIDSKTKSDTDATDDAETDTDATNDAKSAGSQQNDTKAGNDGNGKKNSEEKSDTDEKGDAEENSEPESKSNAEAQIDAQARRQAMASFQADLDGGRIPDTLQKSLSFSDKTTIRPSGEGRWEILDPEGIEQHYAVLRTDDRFEVREWDNWYDFEGSYWTTDRVRGIDRGEPSRAIYAYNMLIGHHGVFSLTPIWVLSVVGLIVMLIGAKGGMRGFALMVLAVSAACFVFYLMRPLEDRNYGGVSCGLRWLFWLAPLWLVAMLPVCDDMAANRWGRFAGLALLLASGISAAYGWSNPWSHPWILDYWLYMHWIAL